MRDYYLHARTVYRLLAASSGSSSASSSSRPDRLPVGGGSVAGVVHPVRRSPLGPSTVASAGSGRAAQVFEAFALAAEHDVGPDLRLRGAHRAERGRSSGRRDADVARARCRSSGGFSAPTAWRRRSTR